MLKKIMGGASSTHTYDNQNTAQVKQPKLETQKQVDDQAKKNIELRSKVNDLKVSSSMNLQKADQYREESKELKNTIKNLEQDRDIVTRAQSEKERIAAIKANYLQKRNNQNK